jgi:2-keto-4-pentenoate hydratase/2-oxohepta-3-ene-1,7-dioic acid hydratase in catechol pathway
MKLVRFGDRGHEKPGILDAEGHRRDCSARFSDWNYSFLESGGLDFLAQLLNSGARQFPIVDESVRWGAPIARPGKVICIGLNYSDHAAESGMPIPAEPIVFLKGSNTVVGPFDSILIPRRSVKTDWEVELGVVVGRNARYLTSIEEAVNHIAGYCISHDVSEREFQLERGGQWTKGKSCDNFNPLGPVLVTGDELRDASNLHMSLDVNGVRQQTGSTSKMIFDCQFLVHYLSQFMTLEAGDVISTGTPPGVGLGKKPPQFLRDGDNVELTIEGLGCQRQVCRNA